MVIFFKITSDITFHQVKQLLSYNNFADVGKIQVKEKAK